MAVINFDASEFRSQFSAFQCSPAYSDSALQMYFDTASLYISNRYRSWCNYLNPAQRKQALYLMTAHLAAISQKAQSGQSVGILTQGSVDKVSVTVAPPPAPNQWQYWLQSTPYGQQLLALLQVCAAGGFYVTPYGYSPTNSIRR